MEGSRGLIYPSGSFKAITAGGLHSCAVNNQGEAVCWGSPNATKPADVQPAT